jgi:hypothetical protein
MSITVAKRLSHFWGPCKIQIEAVPLWLLLNKRDYHQALLGLLGLKPPPPHLPPPRRPPPRPCRLYPPPPPPPRPAEPPVGWRRKLVKPSLVWSGSVVAAVAATSLCRLAAGPGSSSPSKSYLQPPGSKQCSAC